MKQVLSILMAVMNMYENLVQNLSLKTWREDAT